MKKTYSFKCNKYRRFRNPKISYIFDKTLVFSISWEKCGSMNEKIFKGEKSIDILKIVGLIKNLEEHQMNIQLF